MIKEKEVNSPPHRGLARCNIVTTAILCVHEGESDHRQSGNKKLQNVELRISGRMRFLKEQRDEGGETLTFVIYGGVAISPTITDKRKGILRSILSATRIRIHWHPFLESRLNCAHS